MTRSHPAAAGPPGGALGRDRVTLVIGGAYVLVGAANASLGPIGDELRTSLDLSGAVTGLHGAMFGWFLLLYGVVAARVLRATTSARLFRAGVGAVAAGIVVLAAGRHVAVTLAGAAVLGAGAALLVLVVPPLLSARHGPDERAAAFTFVNALSMVGSIVAPLVLAVTLHRAPGWRWPTAALGLVGGGAVLLAAARTRLPADPDPEPAPVGALRLLRRLPEARTRVVVLVLGVSVEFATLFWASTSVQELAGTTSSVGAVGVGLFAGGMVTGRLAGPAVLRRVVDHTVLRASFALAATGALALRFGPGNAGRLAGLAVAGLGVALIYPVAFARLYGAGVPEASVGAVGALASGTAVTVAPLALGALADGLDLGWALLSIPLMAVAGLALVGRRPDPWPVPEPGR